MAARGPEHEQRPAQTFLLQTTAKVPEASSSYSLLAVCLVPAPFVLVWIYPMSRTVLIPPVALPPGLFCLLQAPLHAPGGPGLQRRLKNLPLFLFAGNGSGNQLSSCRWHRSCLDVCFGFSLYPSFPVLLCLCWATFYGGTLGPLESLGLWARVGSGRRTWASCCTCPPVRALRLPHILSFSHSVSNQPI